MIQNRIRCPLLPAILLLGLTACTDRGEPVLDPQTHRQEVEAWREARFTSLRKPDGWFSLVGLFWLRPGENTFGSGPDNALRFPEKAPARAGSFHLENGAVRLQAAPGADLRHEGVPVDTLTLVPDTADAPTVLTLGSLTFHLIERDGRLGIRLKDLESPARAAFTGIPAFAVDPAWRIEGRFEPYTPPRTLAIPTILGTESAQTSPGALVFEVNGTPLRLDVTGEPGDSTYFVIFGDETNGEETYEAGRYLYVAAPDAEGRVVVDFNKAYNPPCVFTPYATCPFPPPQNRLAARIEAGEQKYKGAAVKAL